MIQILANLAKLIFRQKAYYCSHIFTRKYQKFYLFGIERLVQEKPYVGRDHKN